MTKLLASIILVWYLFYWCDCGTQPPVQVAEQALITSLLTGYNKNIRPDDQVSVAITASLSQIVAIDEKQQIMTSSSFISQTWYDKRLSWASNSSSYNISVVMLPVKSLWIPDTMILNSADATGYFTVSDYSLASVNDDGQVYMILPALTIRTRCNMFVRNFPFDKQTCSINLTSWAQGHDRIIYTENKSSVIDISEYSEHAVWALKDVDVVVYIAGDRVPFEDTYNDIISIQLYLQRKPLFFMMNGIFACLILNCVTLISFTLPFASQIALCMVCFMTYSVYSLNFSSLFPQQSDYLMMITLYFLLSIGWTLVSMAWFVTCNFFITKAQMPRSLYVFCGILQKIPLSCFPPAKQDVKTDKQKDVIAENGEFKKSADNEGENAGSIENMKGVPPEKSLALRIHKHNKVESIDKEENSSVPNTESVTPKPININPIETAAGGSMNETNKEAKPKCNFCNRCDTCQAEVNKEKEKGKIKKEFEARCNALNYFVLFCVFLLMFSSDMAVWLLMSK